MTSNAAALPCAVVETEHMWIDMPDGVRLAARLWRPDTDHPVPALLEYIPYRKADMVRARDERNHPFFAAHGYACVRVDMRGSGDSEGHMPDMYAPAELADARTVLHWLADQPWCDGNVGMFGTSWGGTAALQASVGAPGPLKAVIAVCATHDRFEDDIHHMGGCVLSDTFEWGATLPAILACPLTPEAGPDWKERWTNRLESLAFPLEHWVREQARGDYWRHGSVIHQARALNVPILAVGGWSDRYSASVMSLLDARPDLVWGVVGPWGHHYPDQGAPGPAMGFQQLALAWWDHWLKGDGRDPMPWPRLRAWLRDFDPPQDTLTTRQGDWITAGPLAGETEELRLSLSALSRTAAPWAIPSDPTIGLASGDTGYFGRSGGLPLDQSADDQRSLVFQTEPLQEDWILFGAATLQLTGMSATGAGRVVARISDVAPDDQVARITYGVRNLALTDTLDRPQAPPSPGDFAATLRTHPTAYRIRKGHRLRVALSSALWPMIYASGRDDGLRISSGTIDLPRLRHPPQPLTTALPPVDPASNPGGHTRLSAPPLTRWTSTSDEAAEQGWHQPFTAAHCYQTDTVFGFETRMVHRMQTAPLTQDTEVNVKFEIKRPDGVAVVHSELKATCLQGAFDVTCEMEVQWNGSEIWNKVFKMRVPDG